MTAVAVRGDVTVLNQVLGILGTRLGRRFVLIAAAAAIVLAGVLFTPGALAPRGADDGLPRTFGWTAYGTTSAGYAVSVAIGNALADEGYRLRVIPAKNDVSRLTPLRAGQVHFSATGIGTYLAQEGVFEFDTRRWGPQPVRVLLASWADTNNGLVTTARDAGIETAADLRGKRVAWVVGAPALNQNMAAWLAFGGLGWDDVVRVEASGWKASVQGMIDGTIDAAIASTNSSMLYQLEGSPRGLRFLPGPASDHEGWQRMRQSAPWFSPQTATSGVGLSPEQPLEGANYGYPILITYAGQSTQTVYELVRLLDVKFDGYKDAHSSAIGFAIDRQVFDWIVPYHDGAVRYLREIGVWTEAHEAHNQALVARQQVLAEAWQKVTESDVDVDAFSGAWLAERTRALEAAGMDPIWRN